MHPITTAIKIIGISFFTSNQELINTAGSAINESFSKITSEIHEQKIPVNSEKMFIIYSDYEKDFDQNITTGKMKVTVGFEIKNVDNHFKNVDILMIPANNYEVFKTDTGILNEVVFKKWGEIWQDQMLLKKRNFIADFECYTNIQDPNNANAEIFIGINQ